jgi:hypothetical protein
MQSDATDMEMIFFIVVFPVPESEDNADEFQFRPALGSNASFAVSSLLTITLPNEHSASTGFDTRILTQLRDCNALVN